MKEKIINKATEMFLRLGFKSVTMDDIATEMCISKKTIYKFFVNKEVLIAKATETVHTTVNQTLEIVLQKNYNAIQENFEIRKIFTGIFQAADTSPLYQLRKHYPEIYETVISQERNECYRFTRHNIERGMEQGFYREDTDVENSVYFYYSLIFHINSTIKFEKDAQQKEYAALLYHTRAIATPKGIAELEKQISLHQ